MRHPAVPTLRFVCVLAMVFTHEAWAAEFVRFGHGLPYVAAHPILATAVLVLNDGLARVASPLLGLLSGFFAAQSLANAPAADVLAARVRRLYPPVVCWSAAFIAMQAGLAVATADSRALADALRHLTPGDLLGLWHFPADYPLHYLVDLLICTLSAPLLLRALDRIGPRRFIVVCAAIGLALVAADLNHDTPGVNRNSILPRADLFLFFCAGLVVQRRSRLPIDAALDRFALRSPAVIAATLAVFLTGALHWRWLTAMDGVTFVWCGAALMFVTRIAGGLLVLTLWPALVAVTARGIGVSDRVTFRLFCTHALLFSLLQTEIVWRLGSGAAAALYFTGPILAAGLAWLSCAAGDSLRAFVSGSLPRFPVVRSSPRPGSAVRRIAGTR